jgi:hypothetical protein
MARKILMLSALAMSLATPGLYAQTAPAAPAGAAQSVANAVDPASIQALKDMGAHLQTLKRFQVSTELTGERVLADGQKLQHAATADIDVVRPNMLRARMFSPAPNAKSSTTARRRPSPSRRKRPTRPSNSPGTSASWSASWRKDTASKFRWPTCSSGAPRRRRSTRSNRR